MFSGVAEPGREDPGGGYGGEVVGVAAPGHMVVGRGEGSGREYKQREEQQHEAEKTGGHNVEDSGDDGEAGEQKCDPCEDGPECAAQRDPVRDHCGSGWDSREVAEGEINAAEAEENSREDGDASRRAAGVREAQPENQGGDEED